MTRLIVAALALCLVVVAPASAAPPPSPGDRANAQALNNKAIDLYQAGRFEEAAVNFERAYLLAGDPDVLWNLARSLQRNGQLEKAKGYFEELVLKFPGFDPTRREKAYGHIKTIEAALAKRAFEAETRAWKKRGEELTAAGKHVEAAELYLECYRNRPAQPEWLYLAGREYEAGGELKEARRRYVVLEALPNAKRSQRMLARERIAAIDERLARGVEDGPKGGPKLPEVAPDDGPSGLRIAGWATLGAGLVAAGVGTYFYIQAEVDRDAVRDVVSAARGTSSAVSTDEMTLMEARTLEDDADGAATVGAALLVAGGAMVVGGLVMAIVGGGGGGSSSSVDMSASPVVLPGGGGLGIAGPF